jgi:hypothetical protein
MTNLTTRVTQTLASLPAACVFFVVAILLELVTHDLPCFFMVVLAAVNLTLQVSLRLKGHRWKRIAAPLIVFVAVAFYVPQSAKGFAFSDVLVLYQQLTELRTIVSTAQQNLDVLRQNMMALTRKETYQHLLSNTIDHYGLSADTFSRSTIPLVANANGPDLGRVSEVDSVSQRLLASLGQIQSSQSANRAPVAAWESSVYSSDPRFNNQATQQNLSNLGMVQLYEQGQQQLAVSSLVAQQLALQNLKDRNQAAAAMNWWQQVAENEQAQGVSLGGLQEDVQSHRIF